MSANTTRNVVVGSVLLVVVLAVGVGAAYYTGAGSAPGGSGSGDDLTEFPTSTSTAEGASDGTSAGTTTTVTPPFTFTIDAVEDCGTTCRDVTATLGNNQDESATGVTVFTRVYAGEDNTNDADLVWEGKEDVGTIEAGGGHTTTRRVELTLQEARAIDQKGGWITILTTVQTDDRTVTFSDSEQVA